jgi:hypothetical protein
VWWCGKCGGGGAAVRLHVRGGVRGVGSKCTKPSGVLDFGCAV